MGLIDDVRKRRDSWVKRFEEHRQENEDGVELDPEAEEKMIMENRRKVGVFPEKPEEK